MTGIDLEKKKKKKGREKNKECFHKNTLISEPHVAEGQASNLSQA